VCIGWYAIRAAQSAELSDGVPVVSGVRRGCGTSGRRQSAACPSMSSTISSTPHSALSRRMRWRPQLDHCRSQCTSHPVHPVRRTVSTRGPCAPAALPCCTAARVPKQVARVPKQVRVGSALVSVPHSVRPPAVPRMSKRAAAVQSVDTVGRWLCRYRRSSAVDLTACDSRLPCGCSQAVAAPVHGYRALLHRRAEGGVRRCDSGGRAVHGDERDHPVCLQLCTVAVHCVPSPCAVYVRARLDLSRLLRSPCNLCGVRVTYMCCRSLQS
jgi:hypothetical protein